MKLALLPLVLVFALVGTASVSAEAKPVEIKERTEQLPQRLEGIDVDEKLDELLPMDTEFVDENGKNVRLGDYFGGDLPVVVTLNYSNCPMLCSLQLNGFVDALKQLDLTAGKDFRMLTLAIDPEETPDLARKSKARYVGQYERPEAAEGWHFLTGKSVSRVADAIGFSYAYNEKRKEWVHAAALIVATPEGKIARYLYGIEYHPKTVRLSIVESSEGKIGSTIDRLLLYCFHFDETEGRYAPVAMNIMRLGGGMTVLLLGGFLGLFWVRESRKSRQQRTATTGSAR